MTTPRETGWQDAIRKVLEEATEPLHYREISDIIAANGLRENLGATPANSVAGTLSLMRKNGERIDAVGKGYYVLPTVAGRLAKEAEEEEAEAEVAAQDLSRFAIGAYGLYWDRNQVNWKPSRGQLLGQQNDKADPVNFADQDGIYLLHNWGEIAYVGQTITKKSETGLYNRLQSHHDDLAKTYRWDSFSWFGFRAVGGDGQLLPAPQNGTLADVINIIEAMFIEVLVPRLNKQRGVGTSVWGPNLYNQVEDRQLIIDRLSALTTIGSALR